MKNKNMKKKLNQKSKSLKFLYKKLKLNTRMIELDKNKHMNRRY